MTMSTDQIMQDERAFDRWMVSVQPGHKAGDDTLALRLLRRCWEASEAAERERWREIVRRVALDGNRYGLEGVRCTCEPSESGGRMTWTMGADHAR